MKVVCGRWWPVFCSCEHRQIVKIWLWFELEAKVCPKFIQVYPSINRAFLNNTKMWTAFTSRIVKIQHAYGKLFDVKWMFQITDIEITQLLQSINFNANLTRRLWIVDRKLNNSRKHQFHVDHFFSNLWQQNNKQDRILNDAFPRCSCSSALKTKTWEESSGQIRPDSHQFVAF
jgi:hypothetical protein